MDDDETESDFYGEYEGEGETEGSVSTYVESYHTEDFISQPILSEYGTVPIDILEFHHSFGYDCRKRFNLCVVEPDILIFASGNLIHFYDIVKNDITFRRCSTGGGIGHITKNPKFDHIAIGENGIDPPIIIYEWPSMEIVTVLKEGTTRSFSHLRYSPDGLQLVSQGGDPDYLITIWNWRKSKIALQCKSHGQDVYNVIFSPTMPGHMTSCGSGHIKCWKMAKTFTGLKLQGELGRFGKTEISDIIGVYPMPDEKIISGCEWGNILVWNEGLIKIEVMRKKGRSCHESYISQFEYINGELISIGTDGCINVWYYETIDQAEPTEESHFLEVEPIYEFTIGGQSDDNNSHHRRAMLMQIQKKDPTDPDNTLWYAQDGNGGIWLIDLNILQTPKPAEKLLICHAGKIVDMDVADWGPYAATIGEDGCLHIYDYYEKKLILMYQFRDIGCCVVWLPIDVEQSGLTLICGFSTGVIRMISINKLESKKLEMTGENITLTQAIKPHTQRLTRMTLNPSHNIFVTASEDTTIFVFNIKIETSYPKLVPIGYIELPSFATFITWKPDHPTTIFVGCLLGECVQIDLPEEPQPYTTISYRLTECQPIIFNFISVKSSIIREEARLDTERLKAQQIAKKMQELEKLKEENPGLEIDEQTFLESALAEEIALPEIYIPEIPNRVLIAFYTNRNTVLLSMAGYDAGYTYEYSCPEIDHEIENVNNTIITDCDDEEIHSFLFYNDRKYIIFGMNNGRIRVCKLNLEDEADFSNYWILSMHDNYNGIIPSMRLSYDNKMLLTCGHDGNIFSFIIHDIEPPPKVLVPKVEINPEIPTTDVADIEEPDYLSLEQVIVKTEETRIMTEAKREKEKTMAMLRQLTEEYNSILKKNNKLPLSQRLTDEELELDPRITADLNEKLQAQMDLVYRKLEYEVEKSKLRLKKLMDHFIEPITCIPFAIKRILKPDTMVHSLRELKLTGDYAFERIKPVELEDLCHYERRITDVSASLSVRTEDLDIDYDNDEVESPTMMEPLESFLKGLSPRTIQYHLGDEINQMLKKYRALKAKLEEQEEEWKILQSQKPDPKKVNPDDERAIEFARKTIGDYKLKASLNLDADIEDRPTVASKYKEIINSRRKIHVRREEYNDKLRFLRERKVELKEEVKSLIKKLKNIHAELPHQWIKPLPHPPVIDEEVEFPEKKLELEEYTSAAELVKETKKRRQSANIDLPVDEFDEEYEVLLLDESYFRPGKNLNIIIGEKSKLPEDIKTVECTVSPDVIAALDEAEKADTKLEREMKRVRAARKRHEQDEILEYVSKSYETFDEELDTLEKVRLEVVHESVYMNLYLLTMHQELIILKRFEGMENELSNNVKDKSRSKIKINKMIQKSVLRIDEKNNFIIKLQEKIKENQMRYLNSVSENKFYIFFKRICKKKYKPPRPADASSSSESSEDESSSEEEEEEVDVGSSDEERDITLENLDENICPEGCNRNLYEEAFAVREKRYEMENRIKDELRLIETLQKDLDEKRKSLKTIEAELQTDQDKLETFLREKQRQLNDIDVTVILKLHQMQCFNEDDSAEKIQNCVVFDKVRLSQLYARVGELQNETAEQLTKHKNDRHRLTKMKADCESMKRELEDLKGEIKKEMTQKFGQQVSLVSLYEAVLRRLIYDIKADTSSLIKVYDEKIKNIKTEYKQNLQILKSLIEDNTQKLSFMTVLEEELLKLQKTLKVKLIPEEEITKIESQYECDLNKLKAMLKNQERQKEFYMKNLKRSKTLAPIDQSKSKVDKNRTILKFEEIEQDVIKYDEIDEKLSKEDTSVSQEPTFLMDDSEYYKKIIAIRHLLSQVATADEPNTKETVNRMLREITDKLQKAGYCKEEIEKNISDIMNVQYEHQDLSQVSSKETFETLSDIIHKHRSETRESTANEEIKREVRDILNDLFKSVGIEDEKGDVAQNIVHKLKKNKNINSALKYILQKLPSDTDDETKIALSKPIKQTLVKIIKHIEIEEIESVETQED